MNHFINIVDSQNHSGWTALMLAGYYGHIEIVQLLIENGANIEAENFDGQTALNLAELNGNIEIAQLLREKGRLAEE